MRSIVPAPFGRPLLLASVLMLSACASQPPAAVVNYGKSYYGKNASSSRYASRASESYRPSAKEAAIPTAAAAPVPSISSRDVKMENFKTPALPPESHAVTESTSRMAEIIPPKEIQEEHASGFIWPLKGKLISSFGHKGKGISEEGITLAVAAATPIRASASGTVLYAGNKLKPYGHMVILRHENGLTSTYAHAAELRVRQGQRIRQGDVIALAGSSGNALSPQLFYALRENGTPVDPLTRLPALQQTLASVEP